MVVALSDAIPAGQILRITVGPHGVVNALNEWVVVAKAIDAGEAVEPRYAIGFQGVGSMLATLTPRRWRLVATLRAAGPLSVGALATRLRRDCRNVSTDVAVLVDWMVVQRRPDGLVEVPWKEVLMKIKLPQAGAAAFQGGGGDGVGSAGPTYAPIARMRPSTRSSSAQA